VRGCFVRTIDDWLAVNEYPVGSENDRIAWFPIRIAPRNFPACESNRFFECKLPNLKTSEGEPNMPAYFVVELEVTNPTGMEPYRAAVPATLAQYGGRYLTRGGATQLIEGGPEPKRIVILEFADTAAVKRWYDSAEYQKILPIRLATSTGRAFIVEGVS
jgi:uncharacterized protein (DUF1330 family)